MRSIFVSVLGACLIGLLVGCGTGASNSIEKPTNTTPPPSKEQLKGLNAGGGAAGGVSSPGVKPLPLPKKK